MIENTLRFAHVGETELVNEVVADSPGMAQIPLLEALLAAGSEPWDVGSCSLKVVEGIESIFVLEIVVGAEVLFVINVVIETKGRLI